LARNQFAATGEVIVALKEGIVRAALSYMNRPPAPSMFVISLPEMSNPRRKFTYDGSQEHPAFHPSLLNLLKTN
jgi:hypothetical protein